ncbi:MAG: 50S ribosomal protein L4 [Phycisphaeraceae bacterium]|nr:50S ribosomal protein L4 [Phycisphaeraceae bacterium]
MIDLPIYDRAGKQVDTLAIDESLLGAEVRPALLKQAYVMFHANRRQGSARTKNRGRVEGSTKKLYRQKGTGNARVGPRRTPTRKGGGVAFAKTKTREDYRLDMPKKMRRLANRNALLAKLVDGEVKCFDSLAFDAPKTSDFRRSLEAVGVNRTCLVALDRANRNAALSARNIDGCHTIRAEQLNAFELLNHRFLVIDRATLKAFVDGSIHGKEAV